MADLASRSSDIENLRRQAAHVTETALSLISVFAAEANRLNREDEASRLKALLSSIRWQLHQVKHNEDAAEYGHVRADLRSALGRLAVGGAIKMVSKDKRALPLVHHLFKGLPSKEQPFGSVLICIGSKGLPDDVRVVSISRLARDSNREETEVVNELLEHGHILLSERDVHLLVEKLISDVQEGRRRLPVSIKELPELKAAAISDIGPDGLE